MRLPWIRGYVEAVCRLTDDALVIIGWCMADADSVRVIARDGLAAETQWVRYSRPDLPDAPSPAGVVILAQFASPVSDADARVLTVEAGSVRLVRRRPVVAATPDDVAAIVRDRLAWLDSSTRARIRQCLLDGVARAHDSLRFAEAIASVIRALDATPRGDRSASGVSRDGAIDVVLRTGPSSVYVRGWIGTAASLRHCAARSPEGHVVELLPELFRYQLGTADSGPRQGFVAHVSLTTPSVLPRGWTIELADAEGGVTTIEAPAVATDAAVVRAQMLSDVEAHAGAAALLRHHVYPGMTSVQATSPADGRIADELVFGVQPAAPEASIVIGLYQRLDFLEHQLAQFATDPDLRHAEIVYVLDSPELAASFRHAAYQLHDLHRINFRAIILDRNVGYGAANNAGVSVANGRLVLLCNSDVFPAAHGWLSQMIRFHDRTPGIGALGPKLLFEDHTIQHAGLYFEYAPASGVWENRHYFKGFERHLPAAAVTRAVPAVSGACLMIDRALFQRHGGFRACYVQGDYEDSDLCLRLRADGHQNCYLADVELYHLEGQSYGWKERLPTSRYNAWLHSHQWGDVIAATMREFARPAPTVTSL